MPYKKTYRKKPYKKKQYKRKGVPPRKPLSAPNPYMFKRHLSQVVALNPNAFWQTDGNNLGHSFAFALSSIQAQSDFTNLFKYYRLKAARCRMYFSNTSSESDVGGTAANKQMLITIDRNMDGDTVNPATETNYLQSQTCKRRIALGGDRRPIDLYMPLKQANVISTNAAANTNTLMSPKWIATDDPGVTHFGYNIMAQRVDGQAFTTGISNTQYVRILTTLYFECKKVE